jgi:competence protein ComEC
MAVIGKPAFRCIVVYYALLVLSAYFCRKLSETDDDGHLKISGKPALIAKSGIIALVSVMITILCLPKVRGLEVDVLDVGQGDASYIHTTNGTDIFVDGGSSDVSKAGEYRILTFLKSKGVGRIDCWFFSHMDSDHTSGFLELMEADYEVGCLMVGVNLKGSDEEVLLAAEERGISIVYLEAGDAVHFGEGTVKVLSPEPSAIISDANEDSLVFEIADGGFTGIFTGDIGESTEKSLIASGTLGEADFYKTAHHGSKYSNTYDFLQALSPKLAVISCGANNSYGHPSDEAIENISATGARIYITMNDGQVKIRREKDGLTVWTKK